MKVNQLKAGVILSYLSEAVTIFLGIVYTPVMLRLLGQSEYGLYQLAASTISYLSLLSLGFGSSYVRYYSKYKVNNDREGIARLNGMFMIIFSIIGIICALAGSVLVVNTDTMFSKSLSLSEIKVARRLMILMVFNLSISFPGSVFSSYVTANEQYIFQKVLNILKSVLNPFLTLPLLLLGYKSVAVVVVQTVIAVSSFFVNFVFCKKKLGMKFDFKYFNGKLLLELFMFSFWIFLNQIIDQVNWNVGKFILGIYSGTASVAIYSIGAQLNTLYIGFSTAISNVFIPRINKIVSGSNDDKLLTDLFTRVGRIQFVVLSLILSGLIIFGKYFIQIWAGDGYDESYYIVLLLTIPVTVPLIQNLGIEIQRAKKMHQFRSIIYAIIAVINVLVAIPLSQKFGGVGAATATSISFIVGNGIIMNIFYHKKIGLNIIYFWKQILSFIPALVMPMLAGFIIMKYVEFTSIYLFVLFIVAYAIIYCGSMWVCGLNKYEKELVLEPIRKIVNRRKV